MDSAEFEDKYYKYKDVLFRIIFTYVKNVSDTEDILQDVFIKFYERNCSFETEEHEKRWLIRVAVNQSKNHLKLFWNRKRDLFDNDLSNIFVEDASEQNEMLQKVLDLPQNVKGAMYLHYYEGYTCKEIGEILKVKESAIKMRLKKGREILKMDLE